MADLKTGALNAVPLVMSKKKHRDYDRVNFLTRERYCPMTTGEHCDHLIHRFNRRENAEEHEQRVRLTQVMTMAITNTIMGPVRKIPKVKPKVSRADFGPENKKQNDELAKITSTFYAGLGIDHFLGSIALDAGAIDPNAFCLVNFDQFDNRYEKPRAYPTLIDSCDVWDFCYVNGELDYLWVHRDIKYQSNVESPKKDEPKTEMRDGNWFCLYLADYQIEFDQVDPRTITTGTELMYLDATGAIVPSLRSTNAKKASVQFDTEGAYYFRVSDSELYEVTFYQHNSGMVQAFRLGHFPDWETKGRTCVNLWHSSMPYLMKGIKSGSELDISASLHAFLQKLQYERRCPGHTENGQHTECREGWTLDGKAKCKQCDGTGWLVHKSGQDHMTFALPRNKDDFFELSNMVKYVDLPVEVLQWQDGYVDKLEKSCYRAKYNTERFRQDQVQATATGENIDLQSVYDALAPTCSWYSASFVLIQTLISKWSFSKDQDRFVCSHEFPNNLRYEHLADVVELRNNLSKGPLSTAQWRQLDKQLNEHLFEDDEQGLAMANANLALDPFAGKTEATVMSGIAQDLAKRENAVLWFNFNEVLEIAEQQNIEFYLFEPQKQRQIVKNIVAGMILEMDAQAEQQAAKFSTGLNLNDPNADQGSTAGMPPSTDTNPPADAGNP